MGYYAYVTDPITQCVECRSNAVLLGGKSNVIETIVFISKKVSRREGSLLLAGSESLLALV